jgi:hypothetical protein
MNNSGSHVHVITNNIFFLIELGVMFTNQLFTCLFPISANDAGIVGGGGDGGARCVVLNDPIRISDGLGSMSLAVFVLA